MLKTYPLEGQAGPGALHARIEGMTPEGWITAGLFDELVIEERVVVDKLEKGIFLLLADGGVLADEAALLQLFQAGGQDTAILQAVIINQLLARETFGLVPQSLHNLDVTVRILEKGLVQGTVFPAQFPVLRKEEIVNVLGGRFSPDLVENNLKNRTKTAAIVRIEADLRAAKEKYENGPPSAASREYAREQAFKHREVLAPVEAGLNLPKSLRRYAKKALLE